MGLLVTCGGEALDSRTVQHERAHGTAYSLQIMAGKRGVIMERCTACTAKPPLIAIRRHGQRDTDRRCCLLLADQGLTLERRAARAARRRVRRAF